MAVASEPYRQMLFRWLPFAREHFTRCDDEARGGFFGTGHNCLGTMTQAGFVCATGYLAGLNDWPTDCPVSQDETRDMLRLAFRFLFRTHATGGGTTNNGQPWGFGTSDYDVWHPPLYFEQALAALPSYRPLLDKGDLQLMEAALAFEADHHERTGLDPDAHSLPSRGERETTAESNSWTAAMLARAAVLMPGHAHAARWLQAASLFWMNALSVPQDEWDPMVVDGRPRSSWFAGANLGPHYTLEHHGFFHPGYYVWALWPACTSLLEFRRAGRPPLQAALHHFREAFDVLKKLVVWNGRLAFPAGSDWPQYISGQSYLLPVCEYVARANGDAEAAFLAQSLRANLATEQAGNPDGSFVSRRLGAFLRAQPIAFFRDDVDGACVSASAAIFCDSLPESPAPVGEAEFIKRTSGPLLEPAVGLVVAKSPTRFASVSFNANVSKFQSLVIPPDGGHLFRHSCNGHGRLILAGTLSVFGHTHQDLTKERRPIPAWNRLWRIDNGFVSAGQFVRQQFLNTNVPAADQYLAVFALPDNRTVVQIELVQLRGLSRVLESGSGGWMLATDIFTQPATMLRWAGGEADLAAPVPADHQLPIHSNWVNLADKLAIVGLWGGGGFMLHQLKRRTAGRVWTRPRPEVLWPEESLTADELFFGYENHRNEPGGGHLVPQGGMIRDVAFVQVTQVDAAATDTLAPTLLQTQLRAREGQIRGAVIAGRDGQEYLLAVNFGERENALPLGSRQVQWRPVSDAMPARFERQRLVLPGRTCLLAAQVQPK
ncbi:MAG: hypothetical protein PHU85_10755 [Phycisphaerae bacterium]|nr:hypothetical protein [Phycisphaerae bacterium]